jgi:hypothetical protein
MVGWMHHTYDTRALLLHRGWQMKQPAEKGMVKQDDDHPSRLASSARADKVL